ncbi:MAG: SsrA-binding protein SmpB [Byssovorax sp.]
MAKEKKEKEKADETLIVRNKRARFEYELGDRYEAGLALIGSEVKMLRSGVADLTDAYCAIERGEAFLLGMNIPVMPGAAFGHEAKRKRKLLLHAKEIEDIARAVSRDGMTVAVTRLYFKGGRVKAELALARGKKAVDKRESVEGARRGARGPAAMTSARRS